MNINTTGVSIDAKIDRRHLLTQNLEKTTDAMRQSGVTDPVGFIVDVRDHQGRHFAIAVHHSEGATDDEATKHVDQQIADYHELGQIPTKIIVTPLDAARTILPSSSPTATESLRSWESQRQPGQNLVVVMANGGNTYATVELAIATK